MFDKDNLVWTALLALSFGVVVTLQWYRSRPGTSAALSEGPMLPGADRRAALHRIERSAAVDIGLLAATPLFLYALALTRLQFSAGRWNPYGAIPLAALGAGFIIYFGHRLWVTLRTRRKLLRSIADGFAAGLALSRLAADGWQVCHDFRSGRLHVDHVLVGAAGIFAVQVHSPVRSRRRPAEVAYDGRALYFHSRTDTAILQQARRTAAQLSHWIAESVGEPVAVRAVVVLPGWQIKRTAHRGIPVVRLQQLRSLFRHVRPRPLTPSTLESVAGRIAARCLRPPGDPAGAHRPRQRRR